MEEVRIYSSISTVIQTYDYVYANKVCTLMKTGTDKYSYVIVKGELPKKGMLRFEEIPRKIELMKGVMYYPTMYFNYSLNKTDFVEERGMDIITIDRNENVKFVDLYNLLTNNRHWAYDDFKKYTFKII
jgi:hypothetical protein